MKILQIFVTMRLFDPTAFRVPHKKFSVKKLIHVKSLLLNIPSFMKSVLTLSTSKWTFPVVIYFLRHPAAVKTKWGKVWFKLVEMEERWCFCDCCHDGSLHERGVSRGAIKQLHFSLISGTQLYNLSSNKAIKFSSLWVGVSTVGLHQSKHL